MLAKLIKKDTFLQFVYFFYCMQHTHLVAILFSGFNECFHIFWEARTSITNTGIEKLTTNTGIRTNTATHHVHIRTYQFAKISYVIHKTDAGGEH